MAIANSYSVVKGPSIGFFNGAQESAPSVKGPSVRFFAKPYSSIESILSLGDLDSSDMVAVRIEDYVQRTGQNTGDLTGTIYNTNTGSITLDSVKYSKVGPSGPWLSATILSSDPEYSFPSVGDPAGTAFKIPVEIVDDFNGDVWFKIEVSY